MGVPPGSDLDVYSLSRISQQHQAWNIKGTDIKAVLMTKDPKGFIALTANSGKRLPLALGHVQADKKNSHAPSCVLCMPDESFYNPEIGKNVQVMIRSDCYLCILHLEFLASCFSENVLHTLPLNFPSPALVFAYI